MKKQTQNRIEKTINAIKKLHGCKNSKVTHIYKDTRDNAFVCFVRTRKINQFSGKRSTFNEYITISSHYVWGMRCGFFCDPRTERKHFEEIKFYERIF